MLASFFAQGACMCFVRGGLHIHSFHMLAQGVCLFLLHALLRGPTMCFAQGGLHVLCSVRPENALLKRSCICLLRGHACALPRGELYVPCSGGGACKCYCMLYLCLYVPHYTQMFVRRIKLLFYFCRAGCLWPDMGMIGNA